MPKINKTFANSHGEWTQDNPENCLCSQHSCVNMHVPRTTSFTVFIYSCICIGRHINTLHILPSTVNLCYTRTTFMHNAHICIYLYTHLHNLIATRAHYFAINTAWGNVPHRVAVWHFGQSSLLSTTLPLDTHEARTCPKKARVSSLGVSRVRVYDTNMCVCAVQAADAIQLLSTHTHHTTYSRVSTKQIKSQTAKLCIPNSRQPLRACVHPQYIRRNTTSSSHSHTNASLPLLAFSESREFDMYFTCPAQHFC